MIVAIHSPPKGFFRSPPPHNNNELVRFVRKAASLGFRAFQIGPLVDYVSIEGKRLRRVLDDLDMERNVHVGGLFDAEKFALTEKEYIRVQKQIHYGIRLSMEISSQLVSIHPPFFSTEKEMNKELLSKARMRFLKLVEEKADFAHQNHVEIALESFCYRPFIFEGLSDFGQFVSMFPSEKLGALLDIGHLYQMGVDLSEAVRLFKGKLLDIHVHDAALEKDYRKATHLSLGKGTMNFPSIIGLLQEVGYNGWLTLEIRGNEKEIMKSKEYLEKLIIQTS